MASSDVLWFVPFQSGTACTRVQVIASGAKVDARERGAGLAEALALNLDRSVWEHFAAKVAELNSSKEGRRW